MADDKPDNAPEPAAEPGDGDDAPVMPKWVPVVIGLVLVTMAALAVWTGLRYRNPPLVNGIIHMKRPARSMTGGGAPGEPGPGASMVLPGEGDNAPSPNTPITSGARAEITGTGSTVNGMMHLTARRGLTINATPDDAMILISDTPLGTANQLRWPYEFAAPGSYTVKIDAPGFKEQQFIVTASDNATPEVVTVNAVLQKQ
jgi:hypothetical protein